MKSYLAVLIFILAPFVYAQAQNGSDILASAIKNLPPCALQCTLTTVGSSSCELTDFDCIKGKQQLLDDLTKCVRASCSIKEALTAKKFLQQTMNAPVRNKTDLGTFTCLIVGGVALLAFVLRLIARLPLFGGQWGLDDWVMSVAMVLIVPLTVCAYLLNQIGMGTDMWLVSFEHITSILKIFYITELLYLASVALTKISVLLFYLRIFPNTKLRRAIWFTIVLCVLYLIGFVTATALQCLPIRIAWQHWDGEHHGQCLNLNHLGWASAGVNIVLDLVVIGLPMREVKNLSLNWRRKAGVMLMFLGGLFITVVSAVRLEYLIRLADTTNVTWDYLPIGYWSAVETHVSVMVACLPAIRLLQRSIRDRLFPKPAISSSYYGDNSRDSRKKSGSKISTARMWTPKIARSQQDSMGRSEIDKKEFIQLDHYGTRGATSTENFANDEKVTARCSPGTPVPPPFGSNDDDAPLVGGIMVRREYSVGGLHYDTIISDRGNRHTR